MYISVKFYKMAGYKKINLNFFQLTPETVDVDNAKDQIKAIKDVFNTPPEEFTPLMRGENKINLYSTPTFHATEKVYLGTFISNQISEIPPSFDESTNKLEPLPLTENQGLGYPTSFLYDPELRIVMIESVKNGVNINTFCNFLHVNYDIATLQPAFVINPTELQKFYDMQFYKRFKVKIARIQNGNLLRSRKRTIMQITNSADDTNTDYLEYGLSVRFKNETLSLAKIRNFVAEFLRYKETEEVVSLSVSGREDDDAGLENIDFIQEKLRDFIQVGTTRLISDFAINERYHMLVDAYKRHRRNLQVYKLKHVD